MAPSYQRLRRRNTRAAARAASPACVQGVFEVPVVLQQPPVLCGQQKPCCSVPRQSKPVGHVAGSSISHDWLHRLPSLVAVHCQLSQN